ncbi:MAG: contractile injection system protein, VgrG/Pvc8 family [Acetobacteraceae bacterium]|nr:contractile injection system protein, VgrG/Pvc8 family [Acetobacteraceae bacterium]
MSEQLTLTVGGATYAGWTEIEVERGIDRCVSHFDIGVSERWVGRDQAWRILPFQPCTVAIGPDVILTGYVDAYEPRFGRAEHGVRIRGRSKTEDLVDCTPDVPSGQFSGYTVAAIARSICALFGIAVIVQTPQADVVVANTQLQRCESAFGFLERLGRLAGVLLCDDAHGNLVLTTAGSARASGALAQGRNIEQAHGRLDVAKRFSDYTVKGQAGLSAAGAASSWGGAGGVGSTTPAPAGKVQTQQRAAAHDPGVPRYRPRVTLAESQLTASGMQLRANWQRQYAFGQSLKATITVQGWRQPDGSLWAINQLVPVTSDFLGVDQDLLVVKVKYTLGERGGALTVLDVGPPEGYTPDPGQVRLHKAKHGKGHGHGIDWSGAAV